MSNMPTGVLFTAVIVILSVLTGGLVALLTYFHNGIGMVALIIALLWVICGISHDRAQGNEGVVGGAVGGLMGGISVAVLARLCRPDEFELLGSLMFILGGGAGLCIGCALGVNIWLYLGSPFSGNVLPGILHDKKFWMLLRLSSAVTLFTASAVLVLLERH